MAAARGAGAESESNLESVIDRQSQQNTRAVKSAPAKRTWRQKILHEMRVVAIATAYFAVCFGFLMLFKKLTLAQYKVEFAALGMALFAALLAGKVVIVLEKVPMGGWVRRQPAVLEVLLRTALYVAAAFVVLVLERGFKHREESGGWGAGVIDVLKTSDNHQILAAMLCVGVAMLGFNFFIVLHRQYGTWPLLRLFLSKRDKESETL